MEAFFQNQDTMKKGSTSNNPKPNEARATKATVYFEKSHIERIKALAWKRPGGTIKGVLGEAISAYLEENKTETAKALKEYRANH